jgi:beta-N-acetylhexosaminidase
VVPACVGTAAVLLLAGCGVSSAFSGESAESSEPGGRPSLAVTGDPDEPTGWGPTRGELADAMMRASDMTVAEQAATVLMPGFWGYSASEPTPVEVDANREMHGSDSAVDAVRDHGYGSFFLRPEVISDAPQVASLAEELHGAVAPADQLPALLSIDQEGGDVQRLSVGVEAVPSASYVGSTGDAEYARQVARDNGETLAALGVTMVMAPVADVDPDGTSALGSRTYSADPEVTSRMVVASMEGYLDAGVVPVVKHFPGLGSVEGDSHFSLPVQDSSLKQLKAQDLKPFADAIDAGAPAVMTGHVDVQAVDPGVPASLSPEVVQGLLRDRLGFEGVAVTDSQGMGPIHARYGSAEGAVLSLLAGNDLVLNSPEPATALGAVQTAVAEGRLPEERLAEAAGRVLALRIFLDRLRTTD